MYKQPISFIQLLFKDRNNKVLLWIAAIAVVLQFTAFKYFYPYASYIHGDSFVYLDTAYKNLGINTYMIGYSMFLRIFSVFCTSDTGLVGFQYLLQEASALFFLFTLCYFYKLSRIVKVIVFLFIVFNPLFLYMGNLVSSDAFFLSISLIWFTLLLWIIYRPNLKLILWHALILFIAFTVRYNALLYLFISILAFMLSQQSLKRKLVGISISVLLIAIFVSYTSNKYKTVTGIWQYSPFAGWQLTNNAMYAYRYVDSKDRKPVPNKYKALDDMIRQYFDSTRDVKKHPEEDLMASTVYMWDPRLTLYKYRNNLFVKDSTASEFKKWASMGPFYKQYGLYIIREYPLYFVRYFLWPNAQKYYAPPVEFLETYNSGKDSVLPIAKTWFGYKSLRVVTRTKDLEINLLDYYPILSGVINVIMLFATLSFLLLNGWRQDTLFRKGVLLCNVFWLANAGFTIFASSAALRFQSFPILITSVFDCLLLEWLWAMARSTKVEPSTFSIRNPQYTMANNESKK